MAVIEGPIPEEQHREMRAFAGELLVQQAADRLYACALKCRADGHPWPAKLDKIHADLWEFLGWEETVRRLIVGPVGGEDEEPILPAPFYEEVANVG